LDIPEIPRARLFAPPARAVVPKPKTFPQSEPEADGSRCNSDGFRASPAA
jgi:hypothetical protein